MVYEDLRNHRIFDELGMSVAYNDSLINEYFGREKTREFKPMYKEARNQKPPSPPPPPLPPPPPSPPQPIFDRQKALDSAFKSI
mmetsp:Transcript_9914/g.9835  ORF Transcript_9914/g.9835 Transcript_9914/m.9835 type:complete len:84 (+) Transcript_9914:662-913(+)